MTGKALSRKVLEQGGCMRRPGVLQADHHIVIFGSKLLIKSNRDHGTRQQVAWLTSIYSKFMQLRCWHQPLNSAPSTLVRSIEISSCLLISFFVMHYMSSSSETLFESYCKECPAHRPPIVFLIFKRYCGVQIPVV